MAVYVVYQCEQGHESQAAVLGTSTPQCESGFGTWVVYEPVPVMDIVSVVVVGIVALCFALGFIAGQQR